jgi:CBS domain containing-hemolysin-like protein
MIEKAKVKEQVKEQVTDFSFKTTGIVITAMSVVLGLMWKDVIQGYINKWFHIDSKQQDVYLLVVLCITCAFVVFTMVYEKKLKKKQQNKSCS